MANTAPSTPETPRRVAMNRSFTVPTKVAASRRVNASPGIGEADGIETLYVHPNANIIKFSTVSGSRPSSAAGPGSPRSPNPQSAGTLPWASPTERTLAAGPMEIYRVPGSVSFLHSGSLLHAILPRSQCWCVDGVSKFAFRVLPDTYYRIELPGDTPEDLEQVEALKVTLQKVLFYERTSCPFRRSFTVDLPDEPMERRGKRKSLGPAKKWKMDRAYSWKLEHGEEPVRRDSEDSSEPSDSMASEEEVAETSYERAEPQDVDAGDMADEVDDLNLTTTSRPKSLAAARSVTAPAHLPMRSTPPSTVRTNVAVDDTVEVTERVLPSRRTDSAQPQPSTLRTFQAIPTDMPPSPPDSSAGIELLDTPSRLTLGELTQPARGIDAAVGIVSKAALERPAVIDPDSAAVSSPTQNAALSTNTSRRHGQEGKADDTASHREELADSGAPTAPRMLPHDDQGKDPELPALVRKMSPEDPFAAIQARILARRSIGGTTSFHPQSGSSTSSSPSSVATAASTVSRRPEATQHQQVFATALVRKACAVFLGPPAHLVAIMLRIAARFANGTFGFGSSFIIESPAGSKHVPGSFNLESVDADDFTDDLEWEEDDFGVPLRSPVSLAALDEAGSRVKARKGWELE